MELLDIVLFLLPGGKGPQVVIFEGSGFRLVCDGKENYIKDWVEGDIVGIYDFDEFTKAGGYIRLLNQNWETMFVLLKIQTFWTQINVCGYFP